MEYNIDRKSSPVRTDISLLRSPRATGDKPILGSPKTIEATGGSPQKAAVSPPKERPKYTTTTFDKSKANSYTTEGIKKLLLGYIVVHPSYWDHIALGTHIRYYRKDSSVKDKNARFKPGGYVKRKFVSKDGDKMFVIESKKGGKKAREEYMSFPLAYKSIEELWKKYDDNNFIEMNLVQNSITGSKTDIKSISGRLDHLEKIVSALVEKVKSLKTS